MKLRKHEVPNMVWAAKHLVNLSEKCSFEGQRKMKDLELSNHGKQLVEFYKQMASNGLQRTNGEVVEKPYNDFQLAKFRNIVRPKLSAPSIKSVLDYGAGGSNWHKQNFDPESGNSAIEFFNLEKITVFEPARDLLSKEQADCVVCMDVLEHVYIADVPKIVEELFSLSKELLIINVACYKAAALLPNGENAHITVRSPDYWKGLVDCISVRFPKIEVLLICSNSFTSGVVFESFKSSDWAQSESYTVEPKWLSFSAS